MMKALALKKPGTIDGLKIVEIKQPSILADEVRIKVKAVGLNPSDFQTIEYTKDLDSEQVMILGLDISGIVEEVGSDVTDFKKGDRVFYLRELSNKNGGFAEFSVAKSNHLVNIPDNVSFEVAAASPGAGFTAFKAIEQKLRPIAGKTILIHGGAGGVGGYAIQLAKRRGAKVITTCLGRDKDYVLDLGADLVIDFQKENVYEIIGNYTKGLGVNYILSTIGTGGATKDLTILAFDGEIAVTSGFPDFSKIKFYEKQLSIHEIALGLALSNEDLKIQRSIQSIGEKFVELLTNNEIIPPSIDLVELEDIPRKLKEIKKGQITGKVVARIQ